MQILFDNKIKSATLSAIDGHSNYSVDNWKSQFLGLKFKATTYTSVITATFDTEYPIDCFFIGYTNATDLVLRFYSSASVLLGTQTLTNAYSANAYYFTSMNVRWMTITATCPIAEDLYIGGVGVGQSYGALLPVAAFSPVLESKSSSSKSDAGQVSYSYIEPVRKYALSFKGVLYETYRDLIDLFTTVDGGHIWLDITEEAHDRYLPLYCVTSTIGEASRSYERSSFTQTFTEAR